VFEVHIDTSGFRAGLRALLANIENGAQAALQDAAHATEQAARNTRDHRLSEERHAPRHQGAALHAGCCDRGANGHAALTREQHRRRDPTIQRVNG
jgi:hypothetical protein